MGSLSDYYLLPPSQAPKPDTLSDQQKDKDNDKDKGCPHPRLQNLTPPLTSKKTKTMTKTKDAPIIKPDTLSLQPR